MRIPHLIQVVSCLLLASCVAHSSGSSEVDLSIQLGRANPDDKAQVSWRLHPSIEVPPSLELTRRISTSVPRIGVRIRSFSVEVMQESGANPRCGALVEQALADKPARIAGIRKGDIIVRIDGEDVESSKHLNELMLGLGKPGVPLPITILTGKESGSKSGSKTSYVERTLMIAPYAEDVFEEETETVMLEFSEGVQAFTGMRVTDISSELSRRIYGVDRAQVLVTGVVTGSDAYSAGIRAGDRITKIDGNSVDALDDVRSGVQLRALSVKNVLNLYDLGPLDGDAPSTETPVEDLLIEVDGPLGVWESTMPISQQGLAVSRASIPIVFHYESSAEETRTGFLNCILQVGFNYHRRLHPSTTRAPVETSWLSLLPLNMFEVRHGLQGSEYKLFWFIRFGTSS